MIKVYEPMVRGSLPFRGSIYASEKFVVQKLHSMCFINVKKELHINLARTLNVH